ncbi:non-ribosomal peptide synthetase [Pedobacter sp. D749]|uniref:non-ribosomal peptide synthetase n=1 Tax=Pedobacter sp. D749 TaxID=2856523 RepID=UPI001C590B26|nr:non-ribosomal peptide synthetase [Pedobacter sp. D749]QXU43269.1 amino acid adenylation domain-containing protein [Pedobacter sp. D749]
MSLNLTKENIRNVYPLTPMQEGMYLDFLLKRPERTYFEQLSFIQNGELDLDILKECFNKVIERHEVLRTVFTHKVGGKPLQVVLKAAEIEFYFEDISRLQDSKTILLAYKAKDEERFFDLNKSLLFRVAVFKLAVNVFQFVWSWHHIIMDAWCIGLLSNDILYMYNRLNSKKSIDLPPVKPYSSYVNWLSKRNGTQSTAFWSSYLDGLEENIILSNQDLLTSKKSRDQLSLKFDDQTSAAIKKLTQKLNITLNVFVQTVWGILLGKITAKKDVVFGAVVSGRPSEIEGIETIIGLFINTVPVRLKIKENQNVSSLMADAQANALDAESHHYSSLSEIISHNALDKDFINHILIFQNFPFTELDENKDSALKPSNFEVVENFYYDLNIFTQIKGKIELIFEFNTAKYTKLRITAFADYFNTIVMQLLSDPQICVDKISLISETDKRKITGFNQTEKSRSDKTFIQAFEKRIIDHHNKIAVNFKGKRLTYQELNAEANKLSVFLKDQYEIKAGDIVVVMMERSERLIITLLAIMKARAAFLPLEVNYPDTRKKTIIENAQPAVMITDSTFLLGIDIYFSGKIFAADIQLGSLSECGEMATDTSAASDLLYVLFTSGSSGKPKGVQIVNGSFINYMLWANAFYFNNNDGYTFAFFTPITFDLTLTSIFSTLLRGDEIVIYDNDDTAVVLRDVFQVSNLINTVKITPSHITLLKYLGINQTNIKSVIVGGEKLNKEQIHFLLGLNPAVKIYNEYGPTEATIACTAVEITDENAISVGSPIWNTKIHILDENLNLVPIGETGELYISGVAVSSGYIGNTLLTNDCFIADLENPGQKMYRSGDLGYWTDEGVINFVGRKDTQLKIRGYRIELSEIELTIHQIKSVVNAIVIPDKSCTELIAFVTLKNELEIDTIKLFVKERLPSYMCPDIIIILKTIPLTPNGKIDNKQLLRLAASGPVPASVRLPANRYEQEILVVWQAVLGKDAIQTNDSFFNIGGNSLMVVKLFNHLNNYFPDIFTIADLFDHSTIMSQAIYLENKSRSADTISENVIEF